MVFLIRDSSFKPTFRNGCHDLLMTSIDLNDITILNIHGVDYCCIITGSPKSEVMDLLINADSNEKKVDHYDLYLFFIIHKKNTYNFWL